MNIAARMSHARAYDNPPRSGHLFARLRVRDDAVAIASRVGPGTCARLDFIWATANELVATSIDSDSDSQIRAPPVPFSSRPGCCRRSP